MLKNLRVLFIVLLLVSVFAGTASALEVIFKDVSVIDDGIYTRYRTSASTLEEFFVDEDIIIYEKDIISEDIYNPLPDNIEVTISRGFYVNVNVDGKTEKIKVEKDDAVGNLISIVQKSTGLEYVYTEGYYADKLSKGQQINLKSIRTEVITKSEPIPFESEVVEDDKLEKGKEVVVQLGVAGNREIKTEVVYLNNEEDSRKIISDTITLEPVKNILSKGTYVKPVVVAKSVPENKDFNYKKVLTMSATAYTAGYESTGKRPGDYGYGITASGMTAKHGVVAVDPRVIPLGTKLYIENYGYAIAGDTGGAIKGNKIDLFYDSLKDANRFGRKNITVYILE